MVMMLLIMIITKRMTKTLFWRLIKKDHDNNMVCALKWQDEKWRPSECCILGCHTRWEHGSWHFRWERCELVLSLVFQSSVETLTRLVQCNLQGYFSNSVLHRSVEQCSSCMTWVQCSTSTMTSSEITLSLTHSGLSMLWHVSSPSKILESRWAGCRPFVCDFHILKRCNVSLAIVTELVQSLKPNIVFPVPSLHVYKLRRTHTLFI